MARVQTGLETFHKTLPSRLAGTRIGLLSNTASVDRSFRHARHVIARHHPGKLTALFSPQHGFYSEKQDNMVESADGVDSDLQVPVFSLYGKTRQPSREMFDLIDVLFVDLQDVGSARGRPMRASDVYIQLEKTRGIEIGVTSRKMAPLIAETDDLSVAQEGFTGMERVVLPSEWNTDGTIVVQQNNPLPMTVLGISPEYTVGRSRGRE
jgi:hypothetical protein